MKMTKLTQWPYRGRAGVVRDQADIAIALTYGAEIADVIRDDIRAVTRRRKVTAARRLERGRVG